MVNSRQKGKRGELDARDACRQWWFSKNCIRSGQACGKYSADLIGALRGFHVEVKRIKRIAALDYLKQATRDKHETDHPIVLMREDGGTWAVMFPIESSDEFVAAYLANKINNGARSQGSAEVSRPGSPGSSSGEGQS